MAMCLFYPHRGAAVAVEHRVERVARWLLIIYVLAAVDGGRPGCADG